MHAYSTLRFAFDGPKEDVAKAKEFITDRFPDETEEEDGKLTVEETYSCVWLNDIEEFAIEVANQCPNVAFTLSGVIDTSESAGEYMDYEIKYKDGKIVSKFSCWYVSMCFSSYDDYKDFCDSVYDEDGNPVCTEEEFEKLREEDTEVFILDSGSGNVVQEVPLSNVNEYDLDDC